MKIKRNLMAGLVALCGMAQANVVTIGNAAQSASNRDHTRSGGDGFGAAGYTYVYGI